jgi:hypothetical protein
MVRIPFEGLAIGGKRIPSGNGRDAHQKTIPTPLEHCVSIITGNPLIAELRRRNPA